MNGPVVPGQELVNVAGCHLVDDLVYFVDRTGAAKIKNIARHIIRLGP